MHKKLAQQIRDILESTPHLTQRGLAEQMGVNPAAVNRMLYGRRNIMADEIPVIEAYLGQSLQVSAEPIPFGMGRGLSGGRRGHATATAPHLMPMVPVFDFMAVSKRQVVDHVPQFPAQMGHADAFAFYIHDNFTRRYQRGDVIYIHPTRPLTLEKDCCFEMTHGGMVLAQYLGVTDGVCHFFDYQLEQKRSVPVTDILHEYLILARG